MSNRMLVRFSVFLAVIAVFLFVSPRPASADAADLITFQLSGTAVCVSSPLACVGNSTVTVTGTFTLDPDQESNTNSLVALPTFSLVSSDGTVFSSAGFLATSLVVEDAPSTGQDIFSFTDTTGSALINLSVDENNVPDNSSGDFGRVVFGTLSAAPVVFSITSLTLTPVSATPEPSSLSLLSLGAGLLALAFFGRKKLLWGARA